MLRFKQFILEYFTLLEDRIDFLKNQFAGKLDTTHDPYGVHKTHEDIIDHFANNADPTRNKAHTQWILKQYQQKKVRQEDHPRIKTALENFEKYKGKLPNKDINSYKSLNDLEDSVQPHVGSTEPVSKRQETKKVKDEGSELLSSENGVSVRKLKTKEAACEYGKGTKWCTAADKNNMFDHYNKQGPLYFIHGRNEDGELKKYQYHPASNQFMDERDEGVDKKDFVTRNPEILKHPELHHLRIYHPEASSKDIDKALGDKDSDVRAAAASHPNATSDHIDKALADEHHSVRRAAASHPNATSDHIDKALGDEDYEVRKLAASHPNATSDHIDKALADEHHSVRFVAVRHPNATSDHIDKALADEHHSVRKVAASHPNATSDHIDKALGDEDYEVRKLAASHPNATSDHIDKALADEHHSVRRAAASHPNATSDHIDKALGDKDSGVRAAAASHPNATSDNIDKALGDEDFGVRFVAVRHPNATSDHIDKALADEHHSVRREAASHPNATSDHIDKALGDEHWSVRRAAARNPNATSEQKSRLRQK